MPITHFSLDELPWQLGPWRGQTHPEADQVRKQADFADAVLVRTYVNKQGHAAAVYIVFSSTGKDRLHHPEICLRDAGGAVELKADRLIVPLQPHTPHVVERFRYQRDRHERTVVYYWHYTLIPGDGEKQSLLQRIYRQQYDRWPGITVQVQTNMAETQGWQAIETTLLPEIDRWLVEHLPAGAMEGVNRLPVRWLH
jgi:EpsI family protein